MSLPKGTRLGTYEVDVSIGRGGMGEVYRAHDTSLERDVAIKILPDAFLHDADRLARFQREAKVLASLNHPHIAHVYGLERSDIGTALVMELLDGPTLADMIRGSRGLPASDAIAIARQVVDALETAHEQGIVHRDLKPANIKVTDDGVVKVLDFGLAKSVGAAQSGVGELSHSPTMTSPAMTGIGVILGTAAYMSPEQARGKPVDKRTDIWAFGCVLFEMLAGKAPFDGEDVTEVLASVVKSDPDWTLLPPTVPPHLIKLIRRCLEKDRRQRLRDIGDARVDLNEVGASSPAVVGAPATRLIWRERLAWLAALVIVSAAVGAVTWRSRPAASVGAPVTRFTITIPEGHQFNVGPGYRHVTVSPDGRTIVYAANGQLYRRNLDASEPVPITGSNEFGYTPAFSPNGSSIAYMLSNPADGTVIVRKIPANGGPPVTVATLGRITGLAGGAATGDVNVSWEGDQLLGSGAFGMWSAPSSGEAVREAQQLVPLDRSKEIGAWPQLLNGGRHVLYATRSRSGDPQSRSLAIVPIGGGERKLVAPGAFNGILLPTGYLAYSTATQLLGVRFDEARLETVGEPVPLEVDATPRWAVSPSGTLAYETRAGATGPPVMLWVSRDGREESIVTSTLSQLLNMRLSPDRTRVVLSADADLWLWTFGRNTMTRFMPATTGTEYNTAWMPDGRRVVFETGVGPAAREILVRSADGTGAATLLTPRPGGWPNAVSRDSKFLVFHSLGPLPALMLQPIDPIGPAKMIAKPAALNAEFSPDGRWLAYESYETGRPEVYVHPFPALDSGRWQVSTAGGRQPLWSPTGRELFFISHDNMLTAVPIEPGASWVAGTPSALFHAGAYTPGSQGGIRNYDVSADGKRFLVAKRPSSAATITVVTNWFEEVARKVDGRGK